MYQINRLYVLDLHDIICQFYVNKAGKNCEPFRKTSNFEKERGREGEEEGERIARSPCWPWLVLESLAELRMKEWIKRWYGTWFGFEIKWLEVKLLGGSSGDELGVGRTQKGSLEVSWILGGMGWVSYVKNGLKMSRLEVGLKWVERVRGCGLMMGSTELEVGQSVDWGRDLELDVGLTWTRVDLGSRMNGVEVSMGCYEWGVGIGSLVSQDGIS